MIFRAIQAVTCLEASERGGVLANIRTGGGKTLVSGILPYILNAKRPLLLVPANLRSKTRKDFIELRKHWKIASNINVQSYERLGRKEQENFLPEYGADLIICDEAQALKALHDSARARRMARYLAYFPSTKLCAMSGTLGEIDEFAHILRWALREYAPVPKEDEEVAAWASVLNTKVQDHERGDPAELVPHLGKEAEYAPRTAFRDRLIHTPGVIVSVDTFEGCGLIVKPRYVDPSPAVETAFCDLREVFTMPDGWELADAAFEGWHAARQLGLGFYKMHEPRPPQPWRDVRRQYCAFVRTLIECSETFDTEAQVRDAIESGRIKTGPYVPKAGFDQLTGRPIDELAKEAGLDGLSLWGAWVRIRNEYQPKEYPVWLDDSVIDSAIAWGRSQASVGGIIWADSVDFAERLVEKTNWPYFRHMGKDQSRRYIEGPEVKGNETIICSIESNKVGRNLQHKWHRNLVIDAPTSGDDWEQMISRTHRELQKRDTVTVDYMVPCYEYYNAIYQAVMRNEADHETIGQNYRLLNADLVMPSLVGRKGEFAWQRSGKKNKVAA